MLVRPANTNKYRAKPTWVGDIRFASKREAMRYLELLLLNRGGQIRNLELQFPFTFYIKGQPIFKYIADFVYFEGENRIVEDVKGKATALYKLKKRLIECQYGIKIRET